MVVPEAVAVAVGEEDHRALPVHRLQAIGVQFALLLPDHRTALGVLSLAQRQGLGVVGPLDVIDEAGPGRVGHAGDFDFQILLWVQLPPRFLQQQVDEVLQALSVNPDQQLQQNIAQMQREEQQLLSQIRGMTGRYISGEQMVLLLQDVLDQQQNIRLVALENLPAKAVMLPGVAAESRTGAKPLLYRHGTILTFTGPYAGLQQLLQRLEHLPWQLHWRTLDYQVQEYPQAQLQLELETVSEYDSYLKI